jgi:hypothetical protein
MSVRTTDANDKRSSQNENDMQNVGSWSENVMVVPWPVIWVRAMFAPLSNWS